MRNFLLLGATFAVQGSAFDWASSHRDHHRYVDDPFGVYLVLLWYGRV